MSTLTEHYEQAKNLVTEVEFLRSRLETEQARGREKDAEIAALKKRLFEKDAQVRELEQFVYRLRRSCRSPRECVAEPMGVL